MASLFALILIVMIITIVFILFAAAVSYPNRDLEFSVKKYKDLDFIKWRVRQLRQDNKLRHTQHSMGRKI